MRKFPAILAVAAFLLLATALFLIFEGKNDYASPFPHEL
jgi:hypothetical protein